MKETNDELKARLRAEYEKDIEVKQNLNRKYDDKNPRKISMIKSFNYAVEGIIYSLKSQRMQPAFQKMHEYHSLRIHPGIPH